ncbi:LOW QUALITY PROTEIN: transcription factor HES-1-like [Erpetoichthys calabaricus]|uniref:LOW QUALITY PROTEIN: transcription factor HES-1-like n=1 Tax=Erpetoichthys calabaricus TaxID=27687 RepID=UPI0022348473|nr:LOW QUALITY PROTEIN: transcription factor HES-1-like [Erpetoichthys calabaricus]
MLDYKSLSCRMESAHSGKAKTSADHRKTSKPIMEKRRRARINDSLTQLKGLILDVLKKDSPRYSKLEKADILEMTVRHLKDLQHKHCADSLNITSGITNKFRAGFSECIREVTQFLSTSDGIQSDVRSNLLQHLINCISDINTIPSHLMVNVPVVSQMHSHSSTPDNSAFSNVPKANAPGVQVVPLTDGQLAFLLPSTTFPNTRSIQSISNATPIGIKTLGTSELHSSKILLPSQHPSSDVSRNSVHLALNDPVWRPW